MSKEESSKKAKRILEVYTELLEGRIMNKAEMVLKYGVDDRTIERDIEIMRGHLDQELVKTGKAYSILYDRSEKGYRMIKSTEQALTGSELLGICKILLESRAFVKEEMYALLDKLLACKAEEKDRKLLEEMISNERYHYVELQHGVPYENRLWKMEKAVKENRYLKLQYIKVKDKTVVERKVKPVAILFSEYYFYLVAYIEWEERKITEEKDNSEETGKDKDSPAIYRIDRILEYEVLEKRFIVPYKDRFQEGEYKKKIQYMYGGKMRRLKFKYFGHDIDFLLDRFPTAKVIAKNENEWTIQAEVFGEGVDMWLRSQGDRIQVLEEKVI